MQVCKFQSIYTSYTSLLTGSKIDAEKNSPFLFINMKQLLSRYNTVYHDINCMKCGNYTGKYQVHCEPRNGISDMYFVVFWRKNIFVITRPL